MNSASGVLFLFMTLIHFGLCCGPAEIGQTYTITSTADVRSGARVKWQLLSKRQESYFDFSVVVLYDDSESNRNLYPNLYVGTLTQLTIKNVTKKDGTSIFQHNVNGSIVYSCTLPVYKRASSPTCQPVKLLGNNISASCTTAQVYPKAKCQFTLQNEGTDRRDVTDGTSYITYNHTDPQTKGNEYNSTSCTLKYPVDGLKPGNWTVQVNMYPDQTNVSMAEGTVGQATSTLMLSVPTVYIDSNNCPEGLAGEGDTNVRQGYIRQGARANCLCTRAHAGNPPGTIEWRSTQEGSFANVSHSPNAIKIQINSPDGPTEVSISLANDQLREVPDSHLNLCSSEGLDLTVNCAVKQSDVRPSMTIDDFTLTKPNGFITQQQRYLDTSEQGVYRSINKLNVTSGGRHTLVCEAKNPKFSDMKEKQSVTIEVREPPKHSPVISARNSKNNDVLLEGDDVTVTCNVSGGYPPVQSVTLTCDEHNSGTSNGTSAQLTLNQIKQTCKDINCTCQATHVTGCYDLMDFLPLAVLSNSSTKAGVNEENIGPYTTTDLVATAICVFVGTLILEAAIALIVFIIRREKAKDKNRNQDRDQIVRDSDHCYLTINYSDQASVPSSESVKQKTERIYQNQAFGDDTEATEPDLSAYSYINDE